MKLQLEFDLRAKILVYPPARAAAEVREVARQLDEVHGDAAMAYWRSVVANLDRRLSNLGLSRDKIELELRTFFVAVQMEMLRDHGSDSPLKGGTQ